ncbi:MAG: polyisoprenyl-phosphate glycosyltransferase [Clostridiales bacterium]|jgi:dolichol-phosphate mannosyltransferase|nr:glycosyltransferase family 2 protein [Eubacteriales bacterium]MDD3197734.1 glycosyltransferase family 2 protein [Eubacteriales bacterium]MDD4683321.1 glycosyltransferase family 2 protein [Eubacteriales bacterium]MDN5315149.1 polyisoprenyl-phosphate glycosyltransferase [Clostridiales bacterium]
MTKFDISLVVPLYNEEEVIASTHERLMRMIDSQELSFELIYVNDGSRDRTAAIVREFCDQDARVKMLSFSRNFGHQIAITAGMDHSSGEAVVIIDADLQDPPEIIPQMIDLWKQGYQVVYGRRVQRKGETRFKKWSARVFYRLLHSLTDVDIPVDVGDFRLIDACVKDALLNIPEHNRYVRGLISWLGYKQTFVDYVREPRFAGTSKYPFAKMLRLAADGIASFSYKPLKLGISLGIILSIFSLLLAFAVFISRLFDLVWMEPGYASLMCVILFFFGIVLIMLGIIGEYIARIFEEVKGRPLYIICDKQGNFAENKRERAIE